MNTTVLPDFHLTRPVDQVGVEERVARFKARSIKTESKIAGLKLALSMIDLTTLEGMDSPGKVRQLCVKAVQPLEHEGIPSVAAVCVYSPMVSVAKDALRGSNIHVASVATAFPSGMASKENKLDDVKYALDQGADEIDMVISRGRFLAGDYSYVFDEIAEIKTLCGENHLKVILETGELQTLDNVRRASDIALYAGGDFIKTSTGKVKPAATMEVTLVMFEAIRDFYYKTSEKRGMKPAGGIRDSKTALRYLAMLKETLGADWLTSERFRFGASSLANDLLMQIIKQETGRYQSGDYFSID